VKPGDHVVMSYDSCGGCTRCLAGAATYCDQFLPRNLAGVRADGTPGATDNAGQPVGVRWFGQSSFASLALATERNIVPVDPELPLDMLGPLGCSMQTGAGSVLIALGVRPATSIAVFGTGAVGLAAVMAARIAGATEIIAVDLHPGRRELALELGATRALDGADPDLAAAIGQVHYSFDTSGVPAVATTAISVLRPGGTCGLVGAGGGEITLRPDTLAGRSLRYIFEGEAVPQEFIPKLIGLWQGGRFPFDRLLRSYPLDQINDAERDSANGTTIKPILLPER
jgi:aryl-alcohol dehydrogenase